MKKSLFAVALAVILLATNCQKTEIMNPTGTSIGFDSQIGKLTKAADPEGLDSLKAYGFKVWAYRNYVDEYYSGPEKDTYSDGMGAIYDGMSVLPVTFENGEWDTKKDYYWPGAGKELKFFAASSYEADFAITAESVVPNFADEKITVKDFEVKADANNDLMVADVLTLAQGSGDGENGNTVSPTFHHTLTKVQFNFKTDPLTMSEHPVYVLGIKTTALANKGTLVFPYTEGTNPWTAAEGATHEYVDDNEETIAITGTVDGEAEGSTPDRSGLTLTDQYNDLDTWLLLPQDISKSTVTITYIIKDRLFTKTFALYASDLTKWDANQFVKYNVTIAPNLIKFNPSVETWDETNATMNDGGTTVVPDPTPEPDPTPGA